MYRDAIEHIGMNNDSETLKWSDTVVLQTVSLPQQFVETIWWFAKDNRSNNLFSDFSVCTRDAVHCFVKTMLWLISWDNQLHRIKCNIILNFKGCNWCCLCRCIFFCWIILSVLLVREERNDLRFIAQCIYLEYAESFSHFEMVQ